MMSDPRKINPGAAIVACGLLAASFAPALHAQVKANPARTKADVPVYRVDPFWPKLPLPDKMIMQQVVETEIDKDDHVWIINRADPRPDEMGATGNPPRAICCQLGADILEFDTAGNVLKTISGANIPGWPQRLQSLNVDREGNLWVSGTGAGDSIIKISQEGKLLWDFGHRVEKGTRAQQNNQQTDTLNGIGAFALDEEAREIFVADGFVNKRILVFDMNTGVFKRGWGGHGIPLGEIDNDPSPAYDITGPPPDQKQFAPILHCVVLSKDGLVYVCERGSDRVQVFTKAGNFVSAFWVHPETEARGANCGGPFGKDAPCGTVFHLTLSHDPQQKYVYVADGTNNMVWIHDRKTGALAGSFGGNGRYAGQLHWIDAISVDSKGNLYTGEVEDGKRVQKFVITNGYGGAPRL
jgi:DNA-binding beta-propeller fold protein YncE